jgi:ssDNA-binding Zn-finger/Zn-ribbon topoisomerase 1
MQIFVEPVPYCPICGAMMKLHRPPPEKSWKPFWGCNRFPECKGTRNINPETGKPENEEDDWMMEHW